MILALSFVRYFVLFASSFDLFVRSFFRNFAPLACSLVRSSVRSFVPFARLIRSFVLSGNFAALARSSVTWFLSLVRNYVPLARLFVRVVVHSFVTEIVLYFYLFH